MAWVRARRFGAKEALEIMQQDGKTVAILGPTNAAVINAGGDLGFTFHRYFGMRDGLSPEFSVATTSLMFYFLTKQA